MFSAPNATGKGSSGLVVRRLALRSTSDTSGISDALKRLQGVLGERMGGMERGEGCPPVPAARTAAARAAEPPASSWSCEQEASREAVRWGPATAGSGRRIATLQRSVPRRAVGTCVNGFPLALAPKTQLGRRSGQSFSREGEGE